MLRMAIDEPKPFRLLSPKSLNEALDMGGRYWPDAAYLAGGCDLMDQLKHQMVNPRNVIDLKGIAELHGGHAGKDSIRIGALTRLSEIEHDAVLRKAVPALVLAASRVATPQIRNRGTVGGNLLQDSRCPYYRGAFYCYRAGGLECYAHHGLNYEHAVFGGDRCWTVTPSDLAPVMVALDARVDLQTKGGTRTIPAHQLFTWPGDDILHMNIVHSGQILTAIEIPVRAGQRSIFIKNAPRNAWDFSRASVAVALEMQNGTCRNCRIVLGGVATTPWRRQGAEQRVEGQKLSDSVIAAAADAAVSGADPLPDSAYKVPLARQLVREALTTLSQG